MKRLFIAILLIGLLAFGCTQTEQKITDKDALLKAFNDEATPLKCSFTVNETVTQFWKSGKNIATSMKSNNTADGQPSFELRGVYKDSTAYIESKGLMAFMAALVNSFGGTVDASKDIGCDWVKTTATDTTQSLKLGQMTQQDLDTMLSASPTWECSTGGFGDEVFATPGTTCTDTEFKDKAGLNTATTGTDTGTPTDAPVSDTGTATDVPTSDAGTTQAPQ